MSPNIRVGTKVGYIGPTIESPWLPRGTEGVVIALDPLGPFPFICNFNVSEGEDWPMTRSDLEVI